MPKFTHEIDAASLSPAEIVAELRNGDALAARQLGGNVVRSKITAAPGGTLTVEWSSIVKCRELGLTLDRAIAELKSYPASAAPVKTPRAPMSLSKLKAAADRIVDIKSRNDADGDELMALMDDVDKLRPLAKATASAFIAEQKADLSGIVDTLQKMTNLPLAVSEGSAKG